MESDNSNLASLLSPQTLNADTTHAGLHTHTYYYLLGTYLNPSTILLFLAGNILCLLVVYHFITIYRRAISHQQDDSCDLQEETKPRKVMAEPGSWLRPVSTIEMFAASLLILGTGNTAQVLWLSSSQPITPEDVKQALSVIAEKIHVLQVCVAWRWFRPWLRRMKNVVVDFSVDTGDAMSVYYQQMRTPYNISQGPLWRARLVPQPQAVGDRHQAVLVLTLHHIIIDGLTNMIISRDFMEVLNAIMTGRSHNTPTRHIIPAIADELFGMRDCVYCLRYLSTVIYKITTGMFSNTLSFPKSKAKVALTNVLRKDFSAETTQELLRHCKEAKVSVHSSIVAAAYLAFLRTAQKYSKQTLDSLKITYGNAVNMRRYYPSVYKESVGFHASITKHDYVVCSSDAESKVNFWELARRMHDDLQHNLCVSKTPIRISPLSVVLLPVHQVNCLLTRLGCRNLMAAEMACTNMGNLKQILPGKYGDGPVEITSFLRSTAMEVCGSPFYIVFQTFEGKLLLSLDHYINNMTDEVANMFFSYLTHYIADIAHDGTIKNY
ncbi:hypothetical protein OTU49_001448 [Cherax quadricarinatus]|uniref:O-acyltransferase WSD1 C-terminal domain-containing protein n=1 Tax=Cherax quadricarinatus TaxID=27406 RepID=A0AAW0XIZ2_CHEQU